MIGWDAADRSAVEGWFRAGDLPHLSALRARGLSGRVAGLPGLGDDACWGSFATGTEPGVHGRFHHRQIVPGTYRIANFFRGRMQGEPFWSALGRAGRRVAVLDVPKAPLAPELEGIQLADWMPHGEDGPTPVGTPASLAASLADRFRPPPSISCHEARTSTAGLTELRDRVHADLDRRTALALEWLGRERWDLFLTVFAESHCIGHHCWHLHDSAHPSHDREALRTLGNPVAAVYRSLDAALGRLVAACDADTVVLVFSLMGMGTNHMGSPDLVDAVLRRLDERRGGGGARAWARRAVLSLRRKRDTPVNELDVEGRSAFVVHTNSVASAIRVNLVGREPHGIVLPGAYDAHRRFLATSFAALVDPRTGRRLVSEVVSVPERYPGPQTAAFADLLVVWNGDAPITAAASESIGTVTAAAALDPAGNHHPGGWFVAAGPGVAAGTREDAVAVVDFAPTAAAVLGVEIPGPGRPFLAPPASAETMTVTAPGTMDPAV